MSQPEALNDLRATRPAAPAELRARVLAIAAAASPPPRRLTWRRAALVLVPAVLAVAVGAAVVGRGGENAAVREAPPVASITRDTAPYGVVPDAPAASTAPGALGKAVAPAPSGTRPQNYDATLRLRVRDANALSDATKRAVRVAGSLGGFASVVDVEVDGARGSALLRLRVPVTKVQAALQRLAELGTITGESVRVQDAKPGLDALGRRIARLQRQLRTLRADAATPRRRIDALTAQVERLQRARAAAIRQTRLATISLELTTPAPAAAQPDGPLDGAVTALRWLGVGALYALIVGGPIVALLALLYLAVRLQRRRSERRLLGER
jgi:hypothetical protein